ncbi:hypothetical protein Airi01_027750 [Actinoallomurus iriomotensis]|uniref:DUF1707 domain-containing protein n=2 Tax=Thermomonosporaceae TaxID=2012 RepID=A0A9W6REW8_9ACTN|nr:hypothetical protein Airi01_027750 [Actinoallomurus iriomotensis]
MEGMNDALRAADRDRDEVLDLLREHYAQGRLTMEEFDERSTAATSARTLGDLRALTADLPVAAAPGEAAWSAARMRWIGLAGVAALATVVLAGVAVAGHFKFAFPVWLIVLVAVRRAHGGRRIPRTRRVR